MTLSILSEFEKKVLADLESKKTLSPLTRNTYMKHLRAVIGNTPVLSWSPFRKMEKIKETIEPYSPMTRISMIGSVASILSMYKDQRGIKKIHDDFSQYHHDLRLIGNQIKKERNGEKTVKESANWESWENIEKKLEELRINAEALAFKKSKNYQPIQDYLLLALYVKQPPRRLRDYLLMKVVRQSDPQDTEFNYLTFIKNEPKDLIFNQFKTKRTLGPQRFPVPEELKPIITMVLKRHPAKWQTRQASELMPLLVFNDGRPFKNANSITYSLNRIFGKRISATMLRHIFLSDKYEDEENERRTDAEAMAHSVGTQREYIRRDDGDE